MKKLLFYTYWNMENPETNGICKKILSQIKVFRDFGYQVDYTYLKGEDFYINIDGQEKLVQRKKLWTKPIAANTLRKKISGIRYDYMYIRYNCSEWGFVKLLKDQYKKGTKILLELPTVEYEKGLTDSMAGRVYLAVDLAFRKLLKKYVDKIVVFQNYNSVFGIPTIRTINGIEINKIAQKKYTGDLDSINVICVAIYSKWHCLDRFLYGLINYYSNNPKKNINLHVVGDGPSLNGYKDIVRDSNVGSHVKFYGLKSGKELDELYDISDIAVEVLGGHKLGLKTSSAMKSREYMVRGIPYITELESDILPKDWKYMITVPYDDSPIDMNLLIDFSDKYMSSIDDKMNVTKEIREFAEAKIDMKVTMDCIIKEYENE